MSFGVDVYIRYEGTRRALVKVLEDHFLVRIDPKRFWLLDFIEIALTHKRDFPEAFEGRRFGAYDYVLSGTTYIWADVRGSFRDAQVPVMDALAQGLAVRLRSRTAIRFRDDAEHRRYRYVKGKDGPWVVDERTGKRPVGVFGGGG